jgi:hypothetical protein
MDSYTEAILAFLEGHKAVAAVRYQPREPCLHSDLVRWEARNQPFKYALNSPSIPLSLTPHPSLSSDPHPLSRRTAKPYFPLSPPWHVHRSREATLGDAQATGGPASFHARVQRVQPVLGRAHT